MKYFLKEKLKCCLQRCSCKKFTLISYNIIKRKTKVTSRQKYVLDLKGDICKNVSERSFLS